MTVCCEYNSAPYRRSKPAPEIKSPARDLTAKLPRGRGKARPDATSEELARLATTLRLVHGEIEGVAREAEAGSYTRHVARRAARHVARLAAKLNISTGDGRDRLFVRGRSPGTLRALFERHVLAVIDGRTRCAVLDLALRAERLLWAVSSAMSTDRYFEMWALMRHHDANHSGRA